MDFIYDHKYEFKLLTSPGCMHAVVIDVGLCYSYMLIAEKEHDRTQLTPFTFFFAKSTKMIENQLSWARSLQNWTMIEFFGFIWIYNETEMPDTVSFFFGWRIITY